MLNMYDLKMRIRDIITGVFLLFICLANARKVGMKSTSPVALDTPIWFNAEVYPYQGEKLTYQWSDGLYKSQSFDIVGPQSEWMAIYDSDTYWSKTGDRTVTCKIYYADSFHLIPLAVGRLNFKLTDSLNGGIVISQPNVTNINHGKISILNMTNITTIFHDPRGWIHNHTASAEFFYHINNEKTNTVQKAGPCKSPSVMVNISAPGNYLIEGTIALRLSDKVVTPTTTTSTTPTTTTTTTTTTTEKPSNKTTTTTKPTTTTTSPTTTSPPTTTKGPPTPPPVPPNYQCVGKPYAKYEEITETIRTKYIYLYSSVIAGEPIAHYDVTGNTWLKHGQMLHLDVNCTGTGPFSFCYNVTRDFPNGTDASLAHINATVPDTSSTPVCYDAVKNDKCQFKIYRYLRRAGTYTLTIEITNDFSSVVDNVAINIYDEGKKTQLSYIVLPIVFVLLSIMIVVMGVSVYVKNQRRFEVEVADFDFESSDGREYKSFKQVLKEAFYASFATYEPPHRRYVNNIERPTILEEDD